MGGGGTCFPLALSCPHEITPDTFGSDHITLFDFQQCKIESLNANEISKFKKCAEVGRAYWIVGQHDETATYSAYPTIAMLAKPS